MAAIRIVVVLPPGRGEFTTQHEGTNVARHQHTEDGQRRAGQDRVARTTDAPAA